MAGSMPQASPKSGPVSGSRVSTVTVARGPATATATLPRRALASSRPRTARSTADASGAPVVSERRQAAATRASSADALRSAHAAQTGDVGLGAVAGVEQGAHEPVDVGARSRSAHATPVPRGVGPRRLRAAAPRSRARRTRSTPRVEVAASSMARVGVSPALSAGPMPRNRSSTSSTRSPGRRRSRHWRYRSTGSCCQMLEPRPARAGFVTAVPRRAGSEAPGRPEARRGATALMPARATAAPRLPAAGRRTRPPCRPS